MIIRISKKNVYANNILFNENGSYKGFDPNEVFKVYISYFKNKTKLILKFIN